MAWKEISLELAAESVPAAEALLEAGGAIAVTCVDAADEPILEPGPGESPLWSGVRVTALFDEQWPLEPVRERLRAHFGGALQRFNEKRVEDRDWVRAWMDGYQPMCFGERLWVVPHGMEAPDPDAACLRLDPGLAFGTGTHPTTALCLEWLARHPPRGLDVTDFGCGSGILALAALRLGARSATGIDNDGQALTASSENARRNDLGAALQVQMADAPDPAPGGLVMANILSGVLVDLAARITALVRPGGTLVLSGILAEQAPTVTAAYADAIRFEAPVGQDGWVVLVGRRRGDAAAS